MPEKPGDDTGWQSFSDGFRFAAVWQDPVPHTVPEPSLRDLRPVPENVLPQGDAVGLASRGTGDAGTENVSVVKRQLVGDVVPGFPRELRTSSHCSMRPNCWWSFLAGAGNVPLMR